MQGLYTENYKTFHVHELENNIVQMTMLPKLIFRVKVIPITILAALGGVFFWRGFEEIDNLLLKCKGPRTAKAIFKKEKKKS